eukprot:scaffold3556_cov67-Attheya_sp.AAC.4
MAHKEPHLSREWIQMTPMDIITDDGPYGTTPNQGMDPDDTNGHPREWIQMTPMDIVDVELFLYCFATHRTCLIQITEDGSYGTTPSQGMDPDDTNGHR